MTASILGRLKRSHARCNALPMPTNAASIAVLNDITLGCRDLFVTLSCSIRSSPRDLNLGYWEARMGAEASNLACPGSFSEHLSYL